VRTTQFIEEIHVPDGRQKACPCLSQHVQVVATLTAALEAATAAGQWEAVAALAKELGDIARG